MAKYLKSQQQLINSLIEGEPSADAQRNGNARIAARSPTRPLKARRAKDAKTQH